MLKPYELRAREAISANCLLRRARGDDALWVCDLPRRVGDVALREAARRLAELGIICRLDNKARLWSMDLCAAQYAALVAELPLTPPPLPEDDRLHEAYSLCRLLLGKPAPLQTQPLCPLREVLKRMDVNDAQMLALVPSLYESCAELLRMKTPLPCAAGGALALWLLRKEQG